MKSRIALSIVLGLSVVVLALISSDSAVKAQPKNVFVADTGMITLGPNQTLRITVANGLDPATVRFRRFEYSTGLCDVTGCKHTIMSQTVSNPMTLAPGEAASYNEGDTATHVRGVVTSNRADVKVGVLILKTSTGEVLSATFQDIHLDK